MVLPACSRVVAVTLTAVMLSFALVLTAPGEIQVGADAARRGSEASEAARRRQAGVDGAPLARFQRYVRGVVAGDLGRSTVDSRPVGTILREAVPRTVVLTGTALLLAVLVGAVVGTARAWRPQHRGWRLASLALTVLYALPELVVGVALLALFTRVLPWLPAAGMSDPVIELTGSTTARWLDRLRHLVLPASTLALAWCAAVARQQRAATEDAISGRNVQSARAMGRSEWNILRYEVLHLTTPSLWAVVGTMMPVLMAGAVLVETLFGWPGLGQVMVQAVTARDAPVVAGATLLVAALTVTASVLMQVLARWSDPRLRDV